MKFSSIFSTAIVISGLFAYQASAEITLDQWTNPNNPNHVPGVVPGTLDPEYAENCLGVTFNPVNPGFNPDELVGPPHETDELGNPTVMPVLPGEWTCTVDATGTQLGRAGNINIIPIKDEIVSQCLGGDIDTQPCDVVTVCDHRNGKAKKVDCKDVL